MKIFRIVKRSYDIRDALTAWTQSAQRAVNLLQDHAIKSEIVRTYGDPDAWILNQFSDKQMESPAFDAISKYGGKYTVYIETAELEEYDDEDV